MRRVVYGPVPSRRLGRSLGVDLVPPKTCTYDCIYCQLGRTTDLTIAPVAHQPVSEIKAQVVARLDSAPDYISLAGSGEPTLYAALGELIDALKAVTEVPIAVLTNGSLLHLPAVRAALAAADVVLPNLDAGSAQTFERVNRPHPDLSFAQMVNGLVAFRQEYTGSIWLEVFLVEGLNTDAAELAATRRWIEQIGPDRVQVNTATRPAAAGHAPAVPPDRLKRLARELGDDATVIAAYQSAAEPPAFSAQQELVLELLRRRPCTTADVADGLGIHVAEAGKHLGRLQQAGLIEPLRRAGTRYFRASGSR